MDNRQRALNYLGLARRGNNIAIGEEPVGIACRGNHGRLLILAQDAADHTFRRARSFTQNGKPPMIRTPFTKEELGDALFMAAKIGQMTGVDPEDALHRACDKFDSRFRHVETAADKPLAEYTEAELLALWQAAKAAEQS